jgi:hypothetical protein
MHKNTIHERFMRIAPHLDEQAKRLWCANEALALERGGVTYVAQATGVSRTTITTGIMELTGEKALPESGIRKTGGGRKKKQFMIPA